MPLTFAVGRERKDKRGGRQIATWNGAGASGIRKAFKPRKVVGNFEPWRLRPDEDVPRGADGRALYERPHGDVDVAPFPNHRVEQRPASAAVDVVPRVVAVLEGHVLAARQG